MSGYEVAHLDELERLPLDQEGLVWRPVRRHFRIDAFGANAYTAARAGDRVVEDHTEGVNQHEELYFVYSGRVTFSLDGEEVDAPAGTFVFVPPETRRGAVAQEEGTTVVAVGAKRDAPFAVSGWEYGFAAFAYHRAGEDDRALAAMKEGYDRDPDDWAANYNYACLLSLVGQRDEALEKLGKAIDAHSEAAKLARGDSDFDSLRDDPRFTAATERAT